jgi:hypothetical protein
MWAQGATGPAAPARRQCHRPGDTVSLPPSARQRSRKCYKAINPLIEFHPKLAKTAPAGPPPSARSAREAEKGAPAAELEGLFYTFCKIFCSSALPGPKWRVPGGYRHPLPLASPGGGAPPERWAGCRGRLAFRGMASAPGSASNQIDKKNELPPGALKARGPGAEKQRPTPRCPGPCGLPARECCCSLSEACRVVPGLVSVNLCHLPFGRNSCHDEQKRPQLELCPSWERLGRQSTSPLPRTPPDRSGHGWGAPHPFARQPHPSQSLNRQPKHGRGRNPSLVPGNNLPWVVRCK